MSLDRTNRSFSAWIVIAISWLLLALSACNPTPTATPLPTRSFATATPPGGSLVIFWSIINAEASGAAARYTVRINADGGHEPYIYYHDDQILSGASFTVSQPCPPTEPLTFTIAVESADGQRDSMEGSLPLRCPTPAPTLHAAPTTESNIAPAAAGDRPPTGRPAFYALTFSENAAKPPRYIFPAGTTEVVARWHYQHLELGETVHLTVNFTPGRPEAVRQAHLWEQQTYNSDSDGSTTHRLAPDAAGALEPGLYTLRLVMESAPYRFEEASFVVLAAPVELNHAVRLGIEAEGLSGPACLLWQIGPTSDKLTYRQLKSPNPDDLLATWQAHDFAFSPDAAEVAYITGDLRLYDWTNDSYRLLDEARTAWDKPVWSPNGAMLAAPHEAGVTVYYVQGGAPPLDLAGAAHPRFAPDDDRLAFVREDGLWVRGIDGTASEIVSPAWDSIGPAIWGPVGRRIYYVEQGPLKGNPPALYKEGVLWAVDLAGATAEPDSARWSVNPYVNLRELSLSPGGRYLLAKDGRAVVNDPCRLDTRLHIFDLAAEDPMRQVRTLWNLGGGSTEQYIWLSEARFLLVRQPLCGGLTAEFVLVNAATGRASWLGGIPTTTNGPACR